MARYAISDIHGCARTFDALLTMLALEKKDLLYLLGDYINKGPDSKGVLDKIFELQQQKLQVICLRGNHDQMLLDALGKKDEQTWQEQTEKQLTLKSFSASCPQDIPQEYISFIQNLALYHETSDYLMVHAGFNFNEGDIFSDQNAMLNIKVFTEDMQKTGGRKIIHGHVPQSLDSILHRTRVMENVLKIDAGCVYYLNETYGHLVALNLDSLEVVIQDNIDHPYPVNIKK